MVLIIGYDCGFLGAFIRSWRKQTKKGSKVGQPLSLNLYLAEVVAGNKEINNSP